MNFDLHKELYFFEWTRKEQLAASANLPVAILAALAGGVLILIQRFPYGVDLATIVFVLLSLSSAVAWVAGVRFIVRSLRNDWYEQLPSSDKLQQYYEVLLQHYTALGIPEPKKPTHRDFDKYLQLRLAEATTANRTNNTRTAGALYRAIGSIVFALVFAGLSLFPYLAKTLIYESDTPAVRIEGAVEFQMEGSMPDQNDPPSQPQPPPQQPPPQPASPPPTPQGPPNEEVRKDGETREKR